MMWMKQIIPMNRSAARRPGRTENLEGTRRLGVPLVAATLGLLVHGCGVEDPNAIESLERGVLGGAQVAPWPNGVPAHTRAILRTMPIG